jgi:prolipoprotein diacylglyceryltransferase
MSPRAYYTLFMLLAMIAFLLARHWIPKPATLAKLPLKKRLALVLAAFVGGAIGAKLPFVLVYPDGWVAPEAWLADGKTITTAIAVAYLSVELTKASLDIHVKTGDTFALPLALALAIGRWGCFFNGCCYGSPTDLPWGVDFGDGIRRHPTQVYEVLFHLAMALILWQMVRRDLLRWQQLKFYLIAYAVYRFLTEYIRPEPPLWLGWTFYQWVASFMIAALSIQWLYDERLKRLATVSPSSSIAST